MPLARLIHSFDDDAIALWNANFEQGMKVAKVTNAKESWPGKRPRRADKPFARRRDHGNRSGEFGHQQLRPDPRNSEPVDGRPLHLPTEGASNPTYTIFAVSLRGAEQLAKTWGSVAG